MIIQPFLKAASLSALCLVSISFRPIHAQTPVGDTLTQAQSVNGEYISWREHLIDDPVTANVNFSGSDGFVLGDIDRDGIEDIVSVHESDAEYDSASFLEDFVPPIAGHVRIHFGSNDPDRWVNVTVAEAEDVPAPEDAVVVDMNGDGWLDIVAAAERSHLIYLQNPGSDARSAQWPRLILPLTRDKGSYIRVFAADLMVTGCRNSPPPIKAPRLLGLRTMHDQPRLSFTRSMAIHCREKAGKYMSLETTASRKTPNPLISTAMVIWTLWWVLAANRA